VVTAHYTYTGLHDVHKPGVRVDPERPGLLASAMRKSRPSRVARPLLLAVAVLIASVAEAGWLIVDENGDQTLVSRGRLKMNPKQADGQAMVLDLARARVWVADSGRRLYWDGTLEEYCQGLRALMPSPEAQLAEQLKELPPDQREQIIEIVKQKRARAAAAPPPRVAVERTAETETIARLPTRKYRVLVDGKLYEELWLTSEAALVQELELARAPDTFGRMFACMASTGGERPEATAEYRQLFAQGWPLKAVYHGEGGGPGRALVTRVEPREVAERDFAPPADFKAAPLSELFAKR
jgi:mRNA-degrading endonuclease RelE of RelBE toxin-antitoxin system